MMKKYDYNIYCNHQEILINMSNDKRYTQVKFKAITRKHFFFTSVL